MKNILNTLLFSSALVLTFSANAAQTLKADVNGFVCAFCAQGIEKKTRALSQTKDVYVSLKHKIVAVELKDGQSYSADALKKLIVDAGYEVTKIQLVADTAAQIKAKAGKD